MMASCGMQVSHGWLDMMKPLFFPCSNDINPPKETAMRGRANHHTDHGRVPDGVLNRQGTPEKRYYQIFYDQPVPVASPRAVPQPRGMRERLPRDGSMAMGGRQEDTGWFDRTFRSGKGKAKRPLISDPFNFQHKNTAAGNCLITPAPDLPRSAPPFHPMQLSIYVPDSRISPLLSSHISDGGEAPSPPRRALFRDTLDGNATTLAHSRSCSSLSFHIPRRPVNDVLFTSLPTVTGSKVEGTPPSMPPRARARPRASTAPSVEAIVERIAGAMIEKDRLKEEIESVKERQSTCFSRPSSVYSAHGSLPPMPTTSAKPSAKPAMPHPAPFSPERMSIERPRTAPSYQSRYMTDPPTLGHEKHHRSQSLGKPSDQRAKRVAPAPRPVPASASNSQPPLGSPHMIDSSIDTDTPLAPPLPLILVPPLRKKKSLSRVSSWLFPASGEDGDQNGPCKRPHRRHVSHDSVTNAPRALAEGDGFYQTLAPSVALSGRRGSLDSMSDGTRSRPPSEYSTDEDAWVGPATTTATSNWTPGSTPPVGWLGHDTVVADDHATKRRGHTASLSLVRSGTFGLGGWDPRPTSVGIAL